MHTAHHMLIYGCSKPGSSKPIWNCGEMAREYQNNGLPTASPCKEGSQVWILSKAMHFVKSDIDNFITFI